MGANVVDRENIGMIERARGARFLLESPQPVGIAGEIGGQNLDGNFAAQSRIFRAVHFTHAARAQRRDDLVGPEFCARSQSHLCVGLYVGSKPIGTTA